MLLKLKLILLGVCCFLFAGALQAEASINANVSSAYVNQNGDTVFTVNWSPGYIVTPSITWQGVRYGSFRVSPYYVSVIEKNLKTGAIVHIPVSNTGAAVITRGDTDNCTYRVYLEGSYPLNGRPCRDYSNQVSVKVSLPETPVLRNVPTVAEDQKFVVRWSSVDGANIYQLERDTCAAFNSENYEQFWPSANFENMTINVSGTYYYRVRAWNTVPENGGVSSSWSSVEAGEVFSRVPVLPSEIEVTYPESVFLSFSAVPDTFIYEIQVCEDQSFAADVKSYWPSSPVETFSFSAPGVFYLRVRSWNDLPENGGSCSAWAESVIYVKPAAPVLVTAKEEIFEGELLDYQWSDVNPAGAVYYRISYWSDNCSGAVSSSRNIKTQEH